MPAFNPNSKHTVSRSLEARIWAVSKKNVFVQGAGFAKLFLSSLQHAPPFIISPVQSTPPWSCCGMWNPRLFTQGAGWAGLPPGCLCPLPFLLLINILDTWLEGSILEISDATFVNKHNIPGVNYCFFWFVCFNKKKKSALVLNETKGFLFCRAQVSKVYVVFFLFGSESTREFPL